MVKPIAIPPECEGDRLRVGGGDGETEPAEYVVRVGKHGEPMFCTAFTFTTEELADLVEHGGKCWLVLVGAEAPWIVTPFDGEWTP